MAETYSGPLTVELLEKENSEIARIIAGLPDDAELIATPMMDELVYRRKDYDRVIAICERAIQSVLAFPLRIAKLKIAMVNMERRKPTPNMERVDEWMDRVGDILDQSDGLDAPGVRRTVVLFHYNGALVCRVVGDFQGEAEHHRDISDCADDPFSRNNAGYMAHFAEMLRYATEGTVTDEMWQAFKRAGDAYRDTLVPANPRDAQWMANDWGHRIQLAILLGRIQPDEGWMDQCFRDLELLLAKYNVPRGSEYALDILLVMLLRGCVGSAMSVSVALRAARRTVERIISDEGVGDEWRILAALFKAHAIYGTITPAKEEKAEFLRAVLAMPGNGICHAARAVAERMLTA